MAVSLPRAEDMELVPAWLELDAGAGLGARPCGPPSPRGWPADDPGALSARAQLLGLPVARVGESAGPDGRAA